MTDLGAELFKQRAKKKEVDVHSTQGIRIKDDCVIP